MEKTLVTTIVTYKLNVMPKMLYNQQDKEEPLQSFRHTMQVLSSRRPIITGPATVPR